MKWSDLPTIVVVARDPGRGTILLSNLGFQGQGSMWVPESEYDKERSGYDSAVIFTPPECWVQIPDEAGVMQWCGNTATDARAVVCMSCAETFLTNVCSVHVGLHKAHSSTGTIHDGCSSDPAGLVVTSYGLLDKALYDRDHQ